MPPPKSKNKLQTFPGILNCLSKISPFIVEVCEPLWCLTILKTDWTWNSSYQRLFDKVKES